jgi:esterase/lipase superfamily enzyme
MFRWLVTRKFRRYVLQLANSQKWDWIDVVAHSFGTHVSAWGLYGIPEEQSPASTQASTPKIRFVIKSETLSIDDLKIWSVK